MSKLPQPDLAYLLLQADEAEIGISVLTNNVKLLRNKLYAIRKELGLTHLVLTQPPIDGESRLWIIKKKGRE